MKRKAGFTLIELLVVIAIVGLLASIVVLGTRMAISQAYKVRVIAEMRSMHYALEMYNTEHGSYPCDEDRDMPPGLEKYLGSQPHWPAAPYYESVYDWDYWHPDPNSTDSCAGNLAHDPKEPVYQISIRFCDKGDTTLESCRFPREDWVTSEWDHNSSAYWCVSGPCRSHGSAAYSHPGCCLGGNCPDDQISCY